MSLTLAVATACLVISSLVLGIVAWIFQKVRKIHLMTAHLATRSSVEQVYTSTESLLALHLDLGLGKSLPPLRGFTATPDFLRELCRDCLVSKPDVVLELGSGASTIVLAHAARVNGRGHVFTLEQDASYAEQTRQWLRDHGVDRFATVIDAPLMNHKLGNEEYSWYSVSGLPRKGIDLLVVDGPPESTQRQARYPALPLLAKSLRPGARVYVDDAARDDEQAMLRRWASEFPELVQKTRSLERGCVILVKADAATGLR